MRRHLRMDLSDVSMIREEERRVGPTSWGLVLHFDDTDIGGITDGPGASHSLWHLHLDWEIGNSGRRDTGNETRYVLGNFSSLEGSWVGSTRCSVNHGCERTSAILVDLMKGHLDFSSITCCWETVRSANTSASSITSLCGTGWGLNTSSSTSSFGTTTEKLTAVDGGTLMNITGSVVGWDSQ